LNYKSIDIDEELGPDCVGSVLELPFKDCEFDVVCAFQVLEHLPFDDFEKALSEMMRTSKKSIIISLPEVNKAIKVEIKLPGIKSKKLMFRVLPFEVKHRFDGEHYWEIGKKETPLRYVRGTILKVARENNFMIVRDYRLFENHYHRFFVLKKNN
jgi:ubiquinone/menaquinone biosynthesis C-methylase UbiE